MPLSEEDEELDECGEVRASEEGGAGPEDWLELGASGSVLASIGRRVVESKCGLPGERRVVGWMDRSWVLKDSCGEHEKRLRHYWNEYEGRQPLSVKRYRDVYERT